MHKLVFLGKILPGHNPTQVQQKLLDLLRLLPEQAATVFSGKPLVIKKDLSQEEAQRYFDHLAQLGIGVEVDPPLKSSSPFPTLMFEIEPEMPVDKIPPASESVAVPVPPAPVAVAPAVSAAPPLAQMACPKCGEYQPKRTLCRACSVDMPRYLAGQQEAPVETGGVRREVIASAPSPRPSRDLPARNGRAVQQEAPYITPFWERLPKFFLFPLQGANLLVLALLSLSSLLADFLPLPSPLDYLIVQGLIMLVGVRRGFMAMDAISRGYLTVEAQSKMRPDPERNHLPWKLLGVIIAWGIVVDMAARLGSTFGFLVWGFTVVTLPAAVMALSVSNSFAAGLNPVLWVRIVRGVGKSYIALFVFLTLLSGGTGAALPLLAPFLDGWLALPIINFTFLYFMLIMFALMGYVLYQFHWVLDVPVDQAHLAAQSPVPADALGDEIASLVASGDIQGALDLAHEQLTADDLAGQERYHKLLIMAGKRDRALEHGRRYLSILLQKAQGTAAVALFKRLRELDQEFRPVYPQELLKLAQAAHSCREFELALALTQTFDRLHPGHADIAEVHFLSARIHSEAFRRDDMACQILRSLCEKHPGHAVVKEAVPYLRALDAISEAAAGQDLTRVSH